MCGCSGTRTSSKEQQQLSVEQYGAILRTGQYPLYFLLASQLAFLIAWSEASLVPGFCPLDNVSSFNAVCHTGWWVAIEIVTLFVGTIAPTFDLWAISMDKRPTSTTARALVAWIVFLVIALVSNAIHLAASSIEYWSGCTTTLCREYAPYLFSFIWLLVFLMGLEIVLLVRVAMYRQDLLRLNRALLGAPLVGRLGMKLK